MVDLQVAVLQAFLFGSLFTLVGLACVDWNRAFLDAWRWQRKETTPPSLFFYEFYDFDEVGAVTSYRCTKRLECRESSLSGSPTVLMERDAVVG